jgi:hypothetical protein
MNLPTPQDILQANMKSNWVHWSRECATDSAVFETVVNYMLHAEMPQARRAAEIVRLTFGIDQTIMDPYIKEMLIRAQEDIHPGILRCIMYCLQRMNVPIEFQGKVLDLCLPLITHPVQPIAVRVFAMCAAYQISKEHPELYEELAQIISDRIPFEGPAFRSRGRKILNRTWK